MSLSKSLQPYYEDAVVWAKEHPRLAVGVFASGLGVAYLLKRALTGPRLPPGPFSLPLLGSVFDLTARKHLDVMRLREKYGDVFTVWMGREPTVMLASYDAVKEAFLTQMNDFANRPAQAFILDQEMFQDEIFIPQFSEKWARDKKFALSCLRTLGGIKAGMDGDIVDEFSVLINRLRDQNQQPVDIKEMTLTATTNIISGIIFNERLRYDDPNVRKLCDLLTNFNDVFAEFTTLDHILPGFVLRLFGIDHRAKLVAALTVLEDFIAEKVADHRKNYDAANPRDFVDMYLAKPDLKIGKGFYDTIIAFTADATQSVATLMQWIALYLGHHPEIQRKIQAEIDQVVGPSQMITNAERPKLKYTEAVLLEILRICDSTLQSPFHTPIADGIKFRGYDIPKHCNVVAYFYAVHKDPKLFPEADRFDPDRFLDKDGDIVKSNLVIPFGLGRRMCLGEMLTKLELFLFLANVMHMFTISFPADEPKPSLEPAGGLVQFPHPYKAIFTPRD